MSGTLGVILLPTLACNVACDYCFEVKSPIRLSPADLGRLTDRLLDYMEAMGTEDAEIYWQGGEALLMGPDWFQAAGQSMAAAASPRGRRFHHFLQSNLIGYGPRWDPVLREMFDGAVGTSMDFPNDHRRLRDGSTDRYTRAWLDAVTSARRAGLKVSVIAVLHAGTLSAGAEASLGFFADEAGVDDLQVNLPFPGGPSRGGETLDQGGLSRFLRDLADTWMATYAQRGMRLSPFADLVDHYLGRPARLPCIWQPNCAGDFVAIDARGDVALCDCWVTSYPQHRFGNVFGQVGLADLLAGSAARRAFLDRPAGLMDGEDCASCPHLSLCHGGCPVRAFAATHTIQAKDPYCDAYKSVFSKCRDIARDVARTPVLSRRSSARVMTSTSDQPR